MTRGTYVGSFALPSGNTADVYLSDDGLTCWWDREPSPSWPREDVEHYRVVTFPAILRAVADVTGVAVVGVAL